MMPMPKIGPCDGPYDVETHESVNDGRLTIRVLGGPPRDYGRVHLATMGTRDMLEPMALATAHLFAAAPELYEAVSYALYAAHRHHTTTAEECKSDQCSMYRAVLAKAGDQ